jgi:hypothetical protein
VTATPYLYEIAKGNVAGHIPWTKIGFSAAVGTTESDLWPVGGSYVFPTAEMGMEVVSSDNTQDIATIIHNGTATGGSTTTLVDTGADFTSGTAVAVGDTILINKASTNPEFGIVTAITSATELAVAGGFSRGGSPTDRTYDVLDYSAYSGCQAVQICYLDADFANGCEIVVLNGTTAVATTKTDIYRVNAFRVIAAGSGGKTVGNVDIRHVDNTPIYSRVAAGYTRGRNSAYTVPAGKTLYITEFCVAFGYSANQTHFARITTRATQFANTVGTAFRTPGIFYPFTDVVCANSSQLVTLDIPTKLMAGVDIKVSGTGTATGTATIALRGWEE